MRCERTINKKIFRKKKIFVPEIFGDPALLLPLFYKPNIIEKYKKYIGVIPHLSNYEKYLNKNINTKKYLLINPSDHWKTVIDKICSCKCIISSSLHGLICSDAYNIPNIWLDEYKLQEGNLKFIDYFLSQNRNINKINSLSFFQYELLYNSGNKINLEKLIKVFPFQ